MDIDVRLLAPTATLFASGLASYLWHLNRPHKKLSMRLLKSEPLISLQGPARKKLTVQYNDTLAEGTYLLHLAIVNQGNVPIVAQDYQAPIRIEVNPEANILEASVIETWPADLDHRLKEDLQGQGLNLILDINKNIIRVRPILLNPKDEFVVQMLVERYENRIEISQQISGIKRVELFDDSENLARTLAFIGSFIVFFALIFLDPQLPFSLRMPSIPFLLIVLIGFGLHYSGMIWGKKPTNAGFLGLQQFDYSERENMTLKEKQ